MTDDDHSLPIGEAIGDTEVWLTAVRQFPVRIA